MTGAHSPTTDSAIAGVGDSQAHPFQPPENAPPELAEHVAEAPAEAALVDTTHHPETRVATARSDGPEAIR